MLFRVDIRQTNRRKLPIFLRMDLSSEDFEFEEEFPNEDFDPRTGYM